MSRLVDRTGGPVPSPARSEPVPCLRAGQLPSGESGAGKLPPIDVFRLRQVPDQLE